MLTLYNAIHYTGSKDSEMREVLRKINRVKHFSHAK